MIGMDPALQKYVEVNGANAIENIFSDKQEDYANMSPE